MNFWEDLKKKLIIEKEQNNRVFMDFASITSIDPEVQEVIRETEASFFSNPSALYSEAILSKEKVREARSQIADVLNCQKDEIVFTSGGTEGNNLALLGVWEFFKKENFIPHFVTSVIEHPSILEVFKEIESRGGEVTYVKVGEDGCINPKDVSTALKENTVLVSIMYANNEIGTIQPIKEIGKLIKDWRNKNTNNVPYFHIDASQATLYLPLDVLKLHVDMMTLDGIKMYGPRGFGVLYVKAETKINPIIIGGGQERGLRSGTENTGAIVGFAKALLLAESKKESEVRRLSEIRDYAISEIQKNFPNAILHGSKENRLANNVNFCFPKLDAEFAVVSLDVLGFSASYSSSCRTLKEDSSSYVVENIGRKECKDSSLRFTFGRETKKEDIDRLITALKKIVLS